MAEVGLRTGARRRARTLVVAAASIAVACAAVAVATGSSGSAGPAAVVVARPGAPAPAFSLPALSGSAAVGLTAAAGRPVVLSFFASWCDNCRQELATMASLAAAAGSDVRIIGIDVNDEAGAARQLLAQHHLSYPVAFDHSDVVVARYGLVGLPTTVYLDAAHRIVGRTVGALTAGTGRAWLDALERPGA
jgi:peroxiredoxin